MDFPARSSLVLACLLLSASRAASLPETDARPGPVRTLDTRRVFSPPQSAAAWRARAEDLRHQALTSSGLWPVPEKRPLAARVFGRVERDGYSVEKVVLQPTPGFYLGGNLYRPLGRGAGPFPAILNPHGHWDDGRLADTPTGSVIARCIQFARMGIVALAYDMTGYVDTVQFGPRGADGTIRVRQYHALQQKLLRDPTNQLWNLSLLGVQTWNSIRALDFVAGLPDVDPRRIGCTGASGGGSQTFLLAAADDRVAASAPIVMVSCSMQGGCVCENAPALRVEWSNMDYAAAAAPRPQILVAASGDWTRETMTVEGPAVASVYAVLGSPDKLRYTLFEFPHNYNRTTREAVYAFFSRHLLGREAGDRLAEMHYVPEPRADLMAFPDGRLPDDALDEAAFSARWIAERRRAVAARLADRSGRAAAFRAWRHTVLVDPADPVIGATGEAETRDGARRLVVAFGRPGAGERVPGVLWSPARGAARGTLVLVHPAGEGAAEADGPLGPYRRELVRRGFAALSMTAYQTGPGADAAVLARSPFENFASGYNRTVTQERVRDVAAAVAFARSTYAGKPVAVVGFGTGSLPAALAAPVADGVVADPTALNLSDAEWVKPVNFVPGIHLLGGAAGAVQAGGHQALLEPGVSAARAARFVARLRAR